MNKRSSKKTPPPKLTAAQKAANHKANYNWLDVVKPGRGPGYAAEPLTEEQAAWWRKLRENEERATRAVYGALEKEGLQIHKASNGSLEEILIEEGDGGNLQTTGQAQPAAPQLVAHSTSGFRRWLVRNEPQPDLPTAEVQAR